jgi:uncharacterized protein (DUF362 family)
MPVERSDRSDIDRPGDSSPSHITEGPPSVASQVAVVRCEGYDEGAVHQAAGRGLALLGGAEGFVRPGELILLKPNLLVASPPEKHVTTHPAVFRAVALHLQAAGARLSFGVRPALAG